MTDLILKVKDVYKHFKAVKAVDGVSLEVGEGEFIALLGPNGAGKTTLVEMIEGIQKPNKGQIILNGKNWSGNESELHRFIGISLQETMFFDKTTVKETLDVFSSFYKLPFTRIDEILEIIHLTDKRKSYVENLSGGQRQKLALGIAMLHNAHLREQHNTSMILTSHYMEEAEFLCDRIIIMDNGKILAQGTLDQLLIEKGCYEIIEFSLNETLENIDFLLESGFQKTTWDHRLGTGKLLVFDIVSQLPRFMAKLQENNLSLKSLECRKMTLDDLFIDMTGRHLNQ